MFFRRLLKRQNIVRKASTTAIEALEGRVLLAYALDPSFSGDGIAEGVGTGVFAVQPDNKVIGLVDSDTIGRLNANGTPDTTFGTGGTVNTPFAISDLLISNGKIIVAGGD